MQLSKEKLLAIFRRHILGQCLFACQPTTKGELSAVLGEMVREDPNGYKIVEDSDPNRTLVMKPVEDTIGTL